MLQRILLCREPSEPRLRRQILANDLKQGEEVAGASVLWRLRRSTSIETGTFQVQGELMGEEERRDQGNKIVPSPGWYDEFDVGFPTIANYSAAFGEPDAHSGKPSVSGKKLACCFLRISRLQFGTFELLTRYETALWRQAAQLVLMLDSRLRS